MTKAIAFLFNLLVIVIVLKIFAPGLANELISLATTVVAVTNDAVQELQSTGSVESFIQTAEFR